MSVCIGEGAERMGELKVEGLFFLTDVDLIEE